MIIHYRYRLGTRYSSLLDSSIELKNIRGEELSNLSQVDVAYHIHKHPESIYYITKYAEHDSYQRNHAMCLYNEETPLKADDIIGNCQSVKEIYGEYPLDNFDISVINKFNGGRNEQILPYQYRIGSTLNNEKGEEIQNLSQANVAEYIKKFPEHIYYISKYVDQGYLRSVQFGLYYNETPMKAQDIIGNYQSMKEIYGYYPLDNFDISVIKMFNKEYSLALRQILNSEYKCIVIQSNDETNFKSLKQELLETLKDELSVDSGLLFFANGFSNWIDRYEYLHTVSKNKKYLLFEEGLDFNIKNVYSRSFLREILSDDEIFYRQLFQEGHSFNTSHMKVILFCHELPINLGKFGVIRV